jgi:hypothetical protein
LNTFLKCCKCINTWTGQVCDDATLQEKGYTLKERGKIYKKVWHPWLPRKVLAMLWLTMEGLPIGAWHTRIGHQRICNLCDDGVLETLEHGLMRCVVVEEAWSKFRELRVKYALLARHSSWQDILLGELQPPCSEVTNEEEIKWDIGKVLHHHIVNSLDIFKSSLLSFM